MKQNTTIKQWKELSKEQQAKLLSWFKSRPYEWRAFAGTGKVGSGILLSIGQMIEFLEPYISDLATNNQVVNPRVDKWRVFFFYKSTNKITFESKELANALWEAVKEVLNTS